MLAVSLLALVLECAAAPGLVYPDFAAGLPGVGANDCDAHALDVDGSALAAALAPLDPHPP